MSMQLRAGVTLLIVRGIALWLVVPLMVLAFPVIALRRRAGLGQALGWADLNLGAALQRCFPKGAFKTRLDFVPLREMNTVTHRIGIADLA